MASPPPEPAPPAGEPEPAPSEATSGSLPPPPVVPEGGPTLWWRAGGIVATLRPHQWVKNVFVLAPVVFAKEVFVPLLITRAVGAFLLFCLLSSAVYTMNDLADVEADRQHPIKRNRPIAAGRVPVGAARTLTVALVLLATVGAVVGYGAGFVAVALGYIVNNLLYSFKLKHVAYLDVSSIAAGFVLRVVAGGLATEVQVSAYLLLCTALLAAFLGFGKRRHELAAAAANARRQRLALEAYSRRGLDVALWCTAIATIATYLAYTIDPHTRRQFHSDWLWVSTAFVVLAIGRFVTLVRNRPRAESPTQEILRDGPFVAIVLSWVILVMWLVYNLRPS